MNKVTKKVLSVICIIFLVLIGVCYYIYQSEDISDVPNLDGTNNNYPTFTVEIRGEVNRPGIYEVNETFNVKALVILAKNYTKNADLDSVNPNQMLKAHDVIVVKSKLSSKEYDLHKLTKEDFMKLIDLTEKQAQIIYDYIVSVKVVKSYDELNGIGLTSGSIEKIKAKCYI